MKLFRLAPILLLASAMPAAAEQLNFDHRTYPPLKAVLDSGRQEMVLFNSSNPKYVVDRIAIQGSSAKQWTEALDIIARTPGDKVKTIDDWYGEIREKAIKACASLFEELARDNNSVTFARRSTNCGKDKVQTALYRIVAGKRNLFLLNPIYRGEMDAAMREQWLGLLKTAQIKD